jgi:O-antigen ligase
MFGDIFHRRYPPGSLYDGADNWVDDPHNLLLDQLMASGLVGVLAWLILVGLFYQQMHAAAKRSPTSEGRSSAAALLGAMTAYVIQALFNPDTITPTLGFWLFLAYAAALANPIRERAKSRL